MLPEPRKYQNEADLQAIYRLLSLGRSADNGSYYIHPGDLKWWLYYPPLEYDYWQALYLWDDPAGDGQLMGWALVPPTGSTFDVYVRPALRGSPSAWEMYTWAHRQQMQNARLAGKDAMRVFWVSDQDDLLTGWLEGQGFRVESEDPAFVYELTASRQPVPQLDGFVLRSSGGLADVRSRAACQYGAFGSSADFEQYAGRFTRFMQSPVYDPEMDIVAAAPNGEIVAFCIIWTDPLTRAGLLEPVGVHPDFQRKGLGKAILLEAFKRLRQHGMQKAIVSTAVDNLPAIRLYQSVGFQAVHRLRWYKKQA